MQDRAELERLWTSMVRVAHSVLGSRAEAEECASAALLQVLERQTEDVDNLEAFLVTVTKRRALDRARSDGRARRRDARLASRSSLAEPDVAEAVADRAAAAWLAEEAERRLSPQALRVLRAVAEGQPLPDVAEGEGLTLRAAQSLLFRTRRAMQSVWMRAAVVAGAVAGVLRRSVVVAAPAVLAAAVLTLGTLPAPSAGARTTDGDGSFRVEHPASTTGTVHTVTHASSARSRGRVRARRSQPAVPRSAVTVAPAPGLSLKVEDEKHGSGPERGPVGGAVECAQHLNLDPKAGPLGC